MGPSPAWHVVCVLAWFLSGICLSAIITFCTPPWAWHRRPCRHGHFATAEVSLYPPLARRVSGGKHDTPPSLRGEPPLMSE